MRFPAPSDPKAAIERAGLPALPSEGTTVHHHAHLDVMIDDTPIIVPARIGIAGRDGISPLHTHDESGMLHIESLSRDRLTLGQFMTEWDVALDERCVGTSCTDDRNVLRAFVDGTEYKGDPREIILDDLQEIALWYGPRGASPDVPTTYDGFP